MGNIRVLKISDDKAVADKFDLTLHYDVLKIPAGRSKVSVSVGAGKFTTGYYVRMIKYAKDDVPDNDDVWVICYHKGRDVFNPVYFMRDIVAGTVLTNNVTVDQIGEMVNGETTFCFKWLIPVNVFDDMLAKFISGENDH